MLLVPTLLPVLVHNLWTLQQEACTGNSTRRGRCTGLEARQITQHSAAVHVKAFGKSRMQQMELQTCMPHHHIPLQAEGCMSLPLTLSNKTHPSMLQPSVHHCL